MKAVVLVGGFGTRLRPLTLARPKQMLPLNGQTMLERVMTTLASHGVDEAVLALGYRPEIFTDAFPDGTIAGVKMHYAVEPEPLDTAGAIGFAARAAGFTETFIAVNGDVLTDIDLGQLMAKHREWGGEGTIALTPVDDPSRFGVVPIDDQNRVAAFIEKPPADEAPSNWINAGAYVLEASVLDRIPEGERVSIERQVFPEMVASGGLFAMQSDAYWVDAGTPESYLQVALDLINGARSNEPGVSETASIDETATVVGSIVGAGARIAAGAEVRGSMIQAGAIIGEGATVIDSIVGPQATVGAGSVLTAFTVIGDNENIANSSEHAGERVPAS